MGPVRLLSLIGAIVCALVSRITVLLTVTAFSANLDSQQGPVFVHEPPSNVEFHNNTGTVIPCSAQGNPAPLVSWAHQDGTTLRDVAGLRHVRPDGSLVFPPFPAEGFRQDVHDAIYKCVASNTVGTVGSREVRVRAVVRRRYKVQVYDEFVVRGNTAVLRCQVPTFVRDYVTFVSWNRDDGVSILSTVSRGGRYSILNSGELYIRGVQPEDGLKSYSCQTRHRLTGEIINSATSGRLFVTEPHGSSPPKITDSRPFISAKEGETVELPCAGEAFPLPTYRWYKEEEGDLVPLVPNHRMTQLDGSLVIQFINVMDSGKYTCVVNNSVGEERVRTTLIVTAPLTVYIYPQRQVIDVGRPATFNCTIAGHPIRAVVWAKDQKPLPENGRIVLLARDVLHITAVQHEDRGMYQCFAFNDVETSQNAAELRLGDVAPVLLSTFAEEALRPGAFVSLKCTASGNPLPQITWGLDDSPIPDMLRFRVGDYVTPEAHVVSYVNISDIRIEDGGEYECSAGNTVGVAAHVSRLNVYGPPVIRPMRNVSVVAGETMVLRCPVSGYPISAISWKKDGATLPVNHRQSVEPVGKLIVQDVQRNADEGEYTCLAVSKESKSAKGSVYMRVLVAPLIDPQPLPQKVYSNEGMKVKLMCSVVQGDPPIRVIWTKNGFPVPLETDVTLQNFEDSAVLVFRKVTFKDSGNYTCVASNTAASVNRTTALVVNVPPRWVIEPTKSSVVLGQRVAMDCLADGYPHPRISWKKAKGKQAGDFHDVHSSHRRQVFDNGTLVILEAENADGGYYLCQANNGIGAGLSKVVFLTVHTPPSFESKFTSNSVAKGHDSKLKCEASGELPLSVKWEKDKQLLDPTVDRRYSVQEESSSGKITSQLVISDTTRTDSALYTCVVTNQFGSDETNIQLIIQEAPSPPTDVAFREKTSRTLTLTWSPSFNGNSPLTKFTVQYKNETASWGGEVADVSVPGSDTSAVIRGLLPSTTYQFRVSANNALGPSDPSDVITVVTDEEVPGGPPQDVTVHATGSQSLKVTWRPPKRELQHGTIHGYYVGYKGAGSDEPFQYKNVEATDALGEEPETSYLTNLKRLTKYVVIVQAYNNVGAGPRSDEVFAVTLEAAPPTSPVLSAKSTTPSSITVEWERYQDDTSLKDYVLHYKAEGGEWQQRRLSTDRAQYTLEGLRCGTRYRLYITASNSLGTGEPSDPVSVRTRGAAPVSPHKDAFLTVNATVLTLHLSAWQSGGCPILHYSVHLRPKFQGEWKLASERVPAHHPRLDLRHLVPGREYALRVSAHSEAGTTEAEYTFSTLNISIPSPPSKTLPPFVAQDTALPFYKNLTVLLPVVISIAVLVIVIITVIVCLRRQADSSSGGSSGDSQGRKGRQCELVGLSEFPQKGVKEGDPYGKTSYYSSPSRKPMAVASSSHRNHSEDNHEYAEPYTAVPAPRCVVDDGECRTTLSVRPKSDGPYATVKRSPPRPGIQLSSIGQDGTTGQARALQQLWF